MDTDVIVVGGGLSGLMAGFRLHRAGLGVQVLEAAGRPGGVIRSERRDGMLVEHGPNNALDASPAIGELLTELGIAAQRVDARPAAARRYIVHKGALAALPHSLGTFLTTPLLSARAKLRLLAEPFVARSDAAADESIADFVRRRLGEEVFDVAAEPFIAGILAGDPEQLPIAAVAPRLHALEQRYGSLVRGALATAGERRRARGRRRAVSFSFRDGMQTLTDALAAAQPGVECGRRVLRMTAVPGCGFTVELDGGEQRFARAVVLAAPAHAATDIVRPLVPAAAAALAAVPYAPLAVVVSAYRRDQVKHRLDGFGFLAPVTERRPLLGTLFCSTLFEGRAADSAAVLTTFLGGSRDPEAVGLSDGELRIIVRSEMTQLLGATAAPAADAIVRWPHGLPQYTFGHQQRMAELQRAEQAHIGLHFCANYRGGSSIADCIANASQTARRLEAQLRAPAVAPQRSAPLFRAVSPA